MPVEYYYKTVDILQKVFLGMKTISDIPSTTLEEQHYDNTYIINLDDEWIGNIDAMDSTTHPGEIQTCCSLTLWQFSWWDNLTFECDLKLFSKSMKFFFALILTHGDSFTMF